MVNLIKYELQRKWRTLLIFFTIVIFINANVLYRVFGKLQSSEFELIALGSFFGGLLAVFFILFIIDVIYMYSRDLNNKSGYMIFLTPHSGYKILGAKVLTGLIEGFVFLLFFLLLLSINLFGFYSQPFREIVESELATKVFEQFNLTLRDILPFLTANLLTTFVSIVVLILTIYAAISIRKSILAERRFGGLLSFVLFMILTWVNGKITGKVINILNDAEAFNYGIAYFNVISVLQIAFGAALFTLSAYLLEKKMDI